MQKWPASSGKRLFLGLLASFQQGLHDYSFGILSLNRDNSEVNDLAGSLMRCQHICPSCHKKTVFFEHQNTVAVSIPPPPQTESAIIPPLEVRVVYLPEAPEQTRGLTFAALKQLLQPSFLPVKLDRVRPDGSAVTVATLRERLLKLIPPAALAQCANNVILMEAANINASTVQNRVLEDSMPLTSLLSNGASRPPVVYAYCPIHTLKKRLLLLQVESFSTTEPSVESLTYDCLLQRSVRPRDDSPASPLTVDQCIKTSLLGFPQMISYDPDWVAARLRLSIWQNQFRLVREGSPLQVAVDIHISLSLDLTTSF